MMKGIRTLSLIFLGALFSWSASALDLASMCPSFPNPAQGWTGHNSILTINERKTVSTPHADYYISGWNKNYVANYLNACAPDECGSADSKLTIPFDLVQDYSAFTSCEAGYCVAGAVSEKGTQPTATTYDFSSVTKNLTVNDFTNVDCGTSCSVSIDDSQKKVTLTIQDHFKNLVIANTYSNYEIRVKFTPGYVVKDFTANAPTTLDFTESGEYLHHKLSVLYTGSKIEFGKDVKLNVVIDSAAPTNRGFVHLGGDVAVESQSTELDSLWINAPEGDVWFQARIAPMYLNAMISARYVTFDSDVYIYGAISAERLTLYSQFSAIIGQSACFSDPTPSPVAKYHLEESWSGNNGEVKDVSGNNHHGTAINSATTAVDLPAWPNDANRFGTCGYGSFTRSSNQYVEVPHSLPLSMSEEVSVSAWIYPKSYPSSDLASIVTKDTNYEFHLTSSGYIYWYWQVNTSGYPAYNLYSAGTVPLNQWTHITVTYDANRPTQAKMYINGQLSAYYYVPLHTPRLLTNNLPFQIGQDRANRGFDGFIDEVQVFDASLSAAQVLEVYNQRHLCADQTVDLALRITPIRASGLACDGIPIDFSLIDNKTGNVVDGQGQSLFVETTPLSGRDYACWSSNGDISSDRCTTDHDYNARFPSNGPATVRGYIHSKFLNHYNITAYVDSEGLSESAGPYMFLAREASIVPSDGVDGNDTFQVAGREFPFRIMVRGAQGEGNQLNCRVIDIDGSVVVDFSTSQMPTSSSHRLQIKSGQRGWEDANTRLPISFKDGVAGGTETAADGSLKLRLDDAGIVDFTGSGDSGSQTLTSTKRFYFRPFATTFCAQNGALPNYTSESSGGFAPAGSNVDVFLKAFNWQSGLDSNNDGVPNTSVKADNLCSAPVTESYFTHNGYVAESTLAYALRYPSGGSLGDLVLDGLPFAGQVIETTTSNINRSRALNWNEVGTLSISAKQDSYLSQSGFNVPAVVADVGRFYPANFSITRAQWQAAIGQGGIAYLDQPYMSAEVEVAPYPLGATTPVSNYHLFDSALQAGFGLKADPDIPNSLTLDTPSGSWSAALDGTSRWLVTDSDAVLARHYVASSPAQTVENGPFNTGSGASVATKFGLNVVASNDPASFDATSSVSEQNFPTQPPARYGRMVLQSATTTIADSVAIPLRVEFWNGSTFTTNSEDNVSELATMANYVCKTTVWPLGTNSNSKLSGSDTAPWEQVTNGESNVIRAVPDDSHSIREQVQFWMRLGGNRPNGVVSGCGSTLSQPWLQYDWRGLGDEDPSSVVTFGIFRGNDRVIFRGEPGLFGQ
ncbi:LamG domain-containing protein [Vibrio sinaloensis]|uniref:LamG domain-containing protein n=1 Tax=Photobacterium sp. (strain ATCC 43367) TaxID=379097 RepID=UPI0006937F63|nr:LamG domain-containing protein [Vibrio sinaloensis]